MSKICILGAEGAGKTVLLTVLGQKYTTPTKEGIFLEPMNKEASNFIFINWKLMTTEHKWPPPTVPGKLSKLNFNLHYSGTAVELIALDYSGETYRQVLGRGEVEQPYQKELAEHVNSSDIILLLLNLKDVINHDSSERGMENFWLPKATLDYMKNRFPYKLVILVLTQIDRYLEFLKENGTWQNVLMKYIPHVAAAYPNLQILPVSAVNNIDVDDEGHTTPSAQFQQEGIEELVNEIQKALSLFPQQSHHAIQPVDNTPAISVIYSFLNRLSNAPDEKTYGELCKELVFLEPITPGMIVNYYSKVGKIDQGDLKRLEQGAFLCNMTNIVSWGCLILITVGILFESFSFLGKLGFWIMIPLILVDLYSHYLIKIKPTGFVMLIFLGFIYFYLMATLNVHFLISLGVWLALLFIYNKISG